MKRTPIAVLVVAALLLLSAGTAAAMLTGGANHGQQALTAKAGSNTASQNSPDLTLKQAPSRPNTLTNQSVRTYVKQLEWTRAYDLVDNRISGTRQRLSHENVKISMTNTQNNSTKQYHIVDPSVGHLKKLTGWDRARVLAHTPHGYYVLTTTMVHSQSTDPSGPKGSVQGGTALSLQESLYYVTPNKTVRVQLPQYNRINNFSAVGVANFDNASHSINVSATTESGTSNSVTVSSLSPGQARMPFVLNASKFSAGYLPQPNRVIMNGSSANVTVTVSGTSHPVSLTASGHPRADTWAQPVGHIVIIRPSGKPLVVTWYQSQIE